MSEHNDTSRERLEGMLRRWGAQQAADEAASRLPAAPRATRRRGASVLLRWLPTALAAGLLLAAGAVFILTRIERQAHIAAGKSDQDVGGTRTSVLPTTGPAIEYLSRQLAEARKEASDVRNALSEALADNAARDRRIKDLHRDLDEAAAANRRSEGLRSRFTELQKQLALERAKVASVTKTAKRLAAAEEELKTARKELAAAKAAAIMAADKSLDELKRTKARLSVAVAELKRQQDTFRQANQQRTKAREELASLKARHRAALDQIRSVYLAACAPGKTGLEALRQTVRRRDLLGRCTVLQRKARTDAEKKLLARAELALTRLCMLDLSDSVAVRDFAKRLGDGGLIASLDAALGPLAADARTQDWLFETKLILTGVQRVL